jgi:site-specific DNA-methyltransferase (adenine-specific)
MSSNDSPDAPAPSSRYALHLGDCREVLSTIATDSIDAIVTDPPYELTAARQRIALEDRALIERNGQMDLLWA